jgi:uncharacterized membrane protein
MAALAAVAGLIDVLGDARIRALNDVWLHAGSNVIVVLIQIYSWYARYTEGTAAVVPKGLILSLIVVVILLFTGWRAGTWWIGRAWGFRRSRKRSRLPRAGLRELKAWGSSTMRGSARSNHSPCE